MRILSLISAWGYSPGGVERHSIGLREVFAHLGYHHETLAAWCQSSWAGDVPAVRPGQQPPRKWRDQIRVSARVLRDAASDCAADVLLLHGPAPALASTRLASPTLAVNYYPAGLERRINWDESRGRTVLDRAMEESLDLLERHALRRTSGTVVLSQHGAELLRRRPLPVSAAVIPPHVRVSQSSRRRDIDILIARRLAPRMGHDEVLRSIADAVRTHAWSVHIVGAGPLEDRIRDLADRLGLAGLVTFEGTVTDHILSDLYNRARAVLVPARGGEGFGLTCVEALAHGAVPIVSDVPPLRENVLSLAPQLVVSEGRWADALLWLLERGRGRVNTLRSLGRSKAAEFGLDRVAELWDRKLREAMSR